MGAARAPACRAAVVADKTISFLVLIYLVYTPRWSSFGFGLHFGVFPGPAPFTMTVIPAIAGADRDRARALDRVRADRLRAPAADARRCATGASARLAQRLATLPATASSGHPRRAAPPALARPGAARRGRLLGVPDRGAVGVASTRSATPPPLAVLVLAFFVGMLGNLLPLPGGIGGVDGGMIGAFAAFNVDAGLAVVAVLVYRGFTFWLPTVPGVIAYLQLRKTVERWRLEGRRALHYTN